MTKRFIRRCTATLLSTIMLLSCTVGVWAADDIGSGGTTGTDTSGSVGQVVNPTGSAWYSAPGDSGYRIYLAQRPVATQGILNGQPAWLKGLDIYKPYAIYECPTGSSAGLAYIDQGSLGGEAIPQGLIQHSNNGSLFSNLTGKTSNLEHWSMEGGLEGSVFAETFEAAFGKQSNGKYRTEDKEFMENTFLKNYRAQLINAGIPASDLQSWFPKTLNEFRYGVGYESQSEPDLANGFIIIVEPVAFVHNDTKLFAASYQDTYQFGANAGDMHNIFVGSRLFFSMNFMWKLGRVSAKYQYLKDGVEEELSVPWSKQPSNLDTATGRMDVVTGGTDTYGDPSSRYAGFGVYGALAKPVEEDTAKAATNIAYYYNSPIKANQTNITPSKAVSSMITTSVDHAFAAPSSDSLFTNNTSTLAGREFNSWGSTISANVDTLEAIAQNKVSTVYTGKSSWDNSLTLTQYGVYSLKLSGTSAKRLSDLLMSPDITLKTVSAPISGGTLNFGSRYSYGLQSPSTLGGVATDSAETPATYANSASVLVSGADIKQQAQNAYIGNLTNQ